MPTILYRNDQNISPGDVMKIAVFFATDDTSGDDTDVRRGV
ncbi:hypothetical protein ACCT05_10695 [Rhizobium ruizarguesonis]